MHENHTLIINYLKEEVLKEMVKGKTNKDIAKVYLYLRKQLKHMSVIYLINYKFQIEHKLLYAIENKLI